MEGWMGRQADRERAPHFAALLNVFALLPVPLHHPGSSIPHVSPSKDQALMDSEHPSSSTVSMRPRYKFLT